MKRRLAAILISDVVGYARLMEADEAGTLSVLSERHKKIVEPLVRAHSGRIIKLVGDGTVVEFTSAVSAVACALLIQKQMEVANEGTREQAHIVLRIGINLGEVIDEGGDIFGNGVNIAARLESLAGPGGICISGKVYDEVQGKLDLSVRDMGTVQLKNIAKPVTAIHLSLPSERKIPRTVRSPTPDMPSIAVLPFANMSSDPEQDYLSDGICEDIITELSRFRDLLVIARNSSFAYKGKSVDIKNVAQELGVRYVLEGSVRRAANQVRITAQLIDSDMGSHVWGERYDRNLEEILALQDDITRQVVGSIAPQIELAELKRSRKLDGSNLSAYQTALKAQALLYDAVHAGDPTALNEAISLAGDALRLDPRSSHALWTQGLAYGYQHLYRWGPDPDGALSLAAVVADNLIGTDPSNARGYLVRAWVQQFRKNHDAALIDYRRAIDLNPNFAIGLFTMAWGEAVAGMSTAAKDHALLALRLSPRDTNMWLGEAYLALTQATFAEREFEEARKWAKLAIQTGPKAPIRRAIMMACCGHLGDLGMVEEHARALHEFAPDFLADLFAGAIEIYRNPEHYELIIDGLRKAGVVRSL
jgi:adenylate cyclase